MNKEQLESVLNRIAGYFKDSVKKPVIVFHAAEPLLVKDILFDAVNKFRNKFLFGTQTNALLLEKKDVEFVMANGQHITRSVGFAIVRVGKSFTIDEIVFAEKGDLLLLGARSLEGLNLAVDPRRKKLVAAGPVLAA